MIETPIRYIDKAALHGFEDHYPKMLSGGMQQRTALANDPKSCSTNLSARSTTKRRALMQELLLGILEADRKTVLFVTHDIDESIFMAKRVVVMPASPGTIRCDTRIELAHPRHYTMKTSPEFSRYEAQLTEEIRAEAVTAVQMDPGCGTRL